MLIDSTLGMNIWLESITFGRVVKADDVWQKRKKKFLAKFLKKCIDYHKSQPCSIKRLNNKWKIEENTENEFLAPNIKKLKSKVKNIPSNRKLLFFGTFLLRNPKI